MENVQQDYNVWKLAVSKLLIDSSSKSRNIADAILKYIKEKGYCLIGSGIHPNFMQHSQCIYVENDRNDIISTFDDGNNIYDTFEVSGMGGSSDIGYQLIQDESISRTEEIEEYIHSQMW